MVPPLPTSFDSQQFFVSQLQHCTPARAKDLDEVVGKGNLQFHLDEAAIKPDFWISGNRINIPRLCLYRIQAHSYAIFAIVSATLKRIFEVADPETETRIRNASVLLEWATSTDIATFDQDGSYYSFGFVPSVLEGPIREVLNEDQRKFADASFLKTVGWILHHELAHFQLNHLRSSGKDCIEEEREADKYAVDWMCSNPVDTLDAQTTVYGIAVALGWLAIFRVYLDEEDRQHGSGCKRLVAGLEHIEQTVAPEVAAVAWNSAFAILFLHAQRHGLSVNDLSKLDGTRSMIFRLVEIIETAKVH